MRQSLKAWSPATSTAGSVTQAEQLRFLRQKWLSPAIPKLQVSGPKAQTTPSAAGIVLNYFDAAAFLLPSASASHLSHWLENSQCADLLL